MERILWIDHDIDIIGEAIREALIGHYDVVSPLDMTYEKALEFLPEIPEFDLVMSGALLPPGSTARSVRGSEFLGYDFLLRVRQEDTLIPLVLFSVVAGEDFSHQELARLKISHLRKPQRPKDILRHLQMRLKEERANL